MAVASHSKWQLCIVFHLICCTTLAKGANRGRFGAGQFHGSGPEVDSMMGVQSSECDDLEAKLLANILGAAYNPRYMSLTTPSDSEDEEVAPSDSKRSTQSYRPFFVDDGFSEELNNAPAWSLDHFDSDYFTNTKAKRSAGVPRPWECEAVVKWIDLGLDYFPRYMRTVECTKKNCWYGKYTCQPRSFTLKILRRKKGKCVYFNRTEGSVGLPQELRQLWVWEERAVNFCCDCAAA